MNVAEREHDTPAISAVMSAAVTATAPVCGMECGVEVRIVGRWC